MTVPTFQRIGVVANLDKEGAVALLNDFVPALVGAGFDVFVDEELAAVLGGNDGIEFGIPPDCDLITALGGDGTILKVARRFVAVRIPILGFKAGTLGFLTEVPSRESVARMKAGKYVVQDRMRIQARVLDGSREVAVYTGLNDVVVHGSGFSRMVTLRTEVDGTFLREYRADGLILATPTGSTAYSLSAGGPLLTPTIQAICLTPLCPHSLTVRPIVLDADQRIRVQVLAPQVDIAVTVDGQVGCPLQEGQHVVVERSDSVTRLAVPHDYDFFGLLREKL